MRQFGLIASYKWIAGSEHSLDPDSGKLSSQDLDSRLTPVKRRSRHIPPTDSLSNPKSYAITFHDPKLTGRRSVRQD
jgi:hypothetical protein